MHLVRSDATFGLTDSFFSVFISFFFFFYCLIFFISMYIIITASVFSFIIGHCEINTSVDK